MKRIFATILSALTVVITLCLFVGCSSKLDKYKKEKIEELKTYSENVFKDIELDEEETERLKNLIEECKASIKNEKTEEDIDKALSLAENKIDSLALECSFHLKPLGGELKINIKDKPIPYSGKTIKESFFDNNRTYGIAYENENYDPEEKDTRKPSSKKFLTETSAPREIGYIFTTREQLEDVFYEVPEVDFEKKTVICIIKTYYSNTHDTIKKIELSGDELTIWIETTDVPTGPKTPGKNNYIPSQVYQSVYVASIDKINASTIKIIRKKSL